MDDTRRRLIRGLMHPPSGPEVGAKQYAPSPAISDCVANLWTTRWSLPPGSHHTAIVLTEPTINLGLEAGACRITGVQRQIFTRVLEGDGSIVAAKFKPGGAAMLLGGSAAPFTDTVVEAADVLGAEAIGVFQGILDLGDDDARVQALDAYLVGCLQALDEGARRAQAIVAMIEAEAELIQVEDVASRAGLSVRSLQRLLKRWVGVGPKWIIRRYRLREAAERLKVGEGGNLADLALELGYFDQAHFTRDFKATVGESPGAFMARLGRGELVV